MNHGFCSLREIEKLCRTDIRYMYLLDEMKAPSFATFGNFIRNELTDTIEQIFALMSMHTSLKKIMLIWSTHTLMVQRLRLMLINTPGFGRNLVLKTEIRCLLKFLN